MKKAFALLHDVIQKTEFADLPVSKDSKAANEIRYFVDIPLTLEVELGRARKTFRDLLELEEGEVIELNKQAGDAVDMIVNNKLIGRGEVVVLENVLGIRIVEIVSTTDIDKKRLLL